MNSLEYKKRDREIKGYVEVLYDLKTPSEDDVISCYYLNGSGRSSLLTAFMYGEKFDDVLTSKRVIDNYSILYDDYIKLDGSFMIFNKKDNDCGFISEETPNELITFDDVNLVFEVNLDREIHGLTFYFADNTIKNARITLYGVNGEQIIKTISNNEDMVVFIDADGKYTHVLVEVYEWTKPNHHIQLVKLDLGLSHIYKEEELIEFTITEEVDKLLEKTPCNELQLTIGDYDKLYDPLNPKGITKYLTEDIVYIPHIGIVDENGLVNYTQMGTFYFEKKNYKDKEVTLIAYNLMKKLNKVTLLNKEDSLANVALILNGKLKDYLCTYLSKNYDYDYDINIENNAIYSTPNLKLTNLSNFLQNAAMLDGIFYVDRDNKIVIDNVDKNIKNSLSKEQLIDNLIYENTEKIIFKIIKKTYSGTFNNSDEKMKDFEINFVLEKPEQIISVESDYPIFFDYNNSHLTFTGADSVDVVTLPNETGSLLRYMVFLKICGTVGSNVKVIGESINESFSLVTQEKIIGNGDNPKLIIENPFITIFTDTSFDSFKDKLYSYKVSLNYNGDPNIIAGNYIKAESDYGYIPFFVTKHFLKYNGGLSGSIEGVE